MDGTTSSIRLGRTGGTTDADLRACTRFVFHRPGWSADEQVTYRGETFIRLRVRRGDQAYSSVWRIGRAGGLVVLAQETGSRPAGCIGTVREALILVWEAEERRARNNRGDGTPTAE